MLCSTSIKSGEFDMLYQEEKHLADRYSLSYTALGSRIVLTWSVDWQKMNQLHFSVIKLFMKQHVNHSELPASQTGRCAAFLYYIVYISNMKVTKYFWLWEIVKGIFFSILLHFTERCQLHTFSTHRCMHLMIH